MRCFTFNRKSPSWSDPSVIITPVVGIGFIGFHVAESAPTVFMQSFPSVLITIGVLVVTVDRLVQSWFACAACAVALRCMRAGDPAAPRVSL
jgi:hypothetical protein